MAKVDGSLGSLVQGISQQPSRARLPGQSELQENVVNDEVFGLSRRPATFVTGKANKVTPDPQGLSETEHGTLRVNDKKLPYILQAGSVPSLRLIEDGVEKVVHLSVAAAKYMRTNVSNNPFGRRVIFKEMGDTTYVTNTQKKVKMIDAAPPAGRRHTNTVAYLRGAKYNNYSRIDVFIGNVRHSFAYLTPNGGASSHVKFVQVNYIISQLYKMMTTAPQTPADGQATHPWDLPAGEDWLPDVPAGGNFASAGAYAAIHANFNIHVSGEYLIIIPKDPTLDYSVSCTDSSGGDLFEEVSKTVKDVGKLPNRAPNGKVVRVVGSNRKEDDYYMKWVIEGAAEGDITSKKGVWEECTAPAEPYMLDNTSMPHALQWNATDNRYEIVAAEWEPRKAGDNESNPIPTFVGQEILDLIDFQGRSLFLHGPEATLSETDNYRNMFRKTATTTLATDPVNIRSTATDGNSKLVYAVPFNRDVIIFGTNNAQFLISGRKTLEAETASMVLTSEFDADLTVRPQAAHDNIMFLSFTGKYTHLNEMYLMGNQDSHARRVVTDHVPRYILDQATSFTASDGANAAGIVTKDKRTVYLYEYLWVDGRRVQSAWSKWKFSCEVMGAAIDEGKLRIHMKTASGAFFIAEITLYRKDAPGLSFPIYLDYVEEHDLSAANTLVVTYCGLSTDKVRVVAQGTGHNLPIASIVPNGSTDGPNTAVVTLKKPFTGKVLTGELYKTKYIPTMPVIRDGDGVAITGAKLSVTDFQLTYANSGPFKMIRECDYEAPADYWTLDYSGMTLGDPDFKLGAPPIDSGTVEFPFSDTTTTSKMVVECETHYPMTLTEIEWNGNVNHRSRRITNGG